jgi:hypothetical protein
LEDYYATAPIKVSGRERVNHQREEAQPSSMIHQLQRRRREESKANRDAYTLKNLKKSNAKDRHAVFFWKMGSSVRSERTDEADNVGSPKDSVNLPT